MNKNRYKKTSSRIAKRDKTRKHVALFLKIALLTGFLVGAVELLRADFLQVKNFEITGGETVGQENIKKTAENFTTGTNFFLIPKSNIIFLNKGELANALLSKYGRIDKVYINKNILSDNLFLSIVERNADFLWCSVTDQCYFMDKSGLIFEKTADASGKIIFRGVLEGNPLMKYFATAEEIKNYLSLVDIFKNNGFNVSSINIESADKGVAGTDIGDVIFNPGEADLSITAQNVVLLVNEIKSKTPSIRFNYIDARFGNKIFYKLK